MVHVFGFGIHWRSRLVLGRFLAGAAGVRDGIFFIVGLFGGILFPTRRGQRSEDGCALRILFYF